ncbi:xanthine dehydrogenase family protein molybdopterin-binding subunit [Pelagicoccus albus]|uniref:Xanthine dehydrogenase family protein molybdopterin-binding subunit n=1 Tax=Pelagicoccus albus TaxID=415222 RepID=A0A7X1B311_9BACT|nr:xanthine dehydrogenase family protein molybdopterin-binding subunit [Pelagicoccus albus]MBC2604703.1 xanthine dehydrogenase family protein molybdopterin-binding subunit [Pelagicoccus albus]
MKPHSFGQRSRRLEDPKLLAGKALFVDDVQRPEMLHLCFVRSPYAHARIRSIDTKSARALDGVCGVFTAEDMGDTYKSGPLIVPPPPIQDLVFRQRTQWPMASDKTRYAGEPVAVVVAESRYIAEDAAELVEVEYEPLAPVVGFQDSLSENAALIHEDLDSNLAAEALQQKGDYDKNVSSADLIVSDVFHYERPLAASMENRGYVAEYDFHTEKMTVWATTQAPIPLRNLLADYLGLREGQVEVVAPFIGGGFGPKIMIMYSEEMVIGWLSLKLKRPIKWIEDRTENFVATTQERGQVHHAEMALTADGVIIGVKDDFIHDTGAYNPYGLTVPLNSQCTLLGPYKVPHYKSRFKAVYTNKTPVTPVRGAGRQHGVFTMERLLDKAAKKLNLSPHEIRRRNFLKPDDFPHKHGIIYQDFSALTYDSGNYEPALDLALEHIGYESFKQKEQADYLAQGRRVGIGLAAYVEGSGIGPYEGARVTVGSDGSVAVATGIGTQGQGHFTVFAQIVREQLGVPLEMIRVTTGDTRIFHWGTGTFASRGAVVGGNACHAAAQAVRSKILQMAALKWNVPAGSLELSDGFVQVVNDPTRKMGLGELAREANPLRGAVPPDAEPGLEATRYFGPEMGATANGVHAAIVEIDPNTYEIKVLRYVIVHDCGKVINPMILEGQILGGFSMGLGHALYESLNYDSQGVLSGTNLHDYMMPTAPDMPEVVTDHVETPATKNPLGVKGAGEAGTIPVSAVIAQAVDDAFSEQDLYIRKIPLTPSLLFSNLRETSTL